MWEESSSGVAQYSDGSGSTSHMKVHVSSGLASAGFPICSMCRITVLRRPSTFGFTATEARGLIRDGDMGGRGRKSEGSTADTARKRPERPWTGSKRWFQVVVSHLH